jgi:ATP-dependent Clp protease ATP-binding subunit ClpC
MGHNFVGTEQLLLGVIGQRHGIGARALRKLKVTLKKARKEIELYIGRGTGFVASEILLPTSKESVRNGSPRR